MRAILLTLLAAFSLSAQASQTNCAAVSAAAARSEFGAASIKRASAFDPAMFGPGSGSLGGGPGTNDPGRITGAHLPLATFIMAAYGFVFDQVSGPDWMRDSINNGFTLSATMPTTTTQEEYCGMLRNLLTARFHLAFHMEKQLRPGYELTVLPGGPKFKQYDPRDPGPDPVPNTRQDKNGFPLMPATQPGAISIAMSSAGLRQLSFRNDMDAFARALGNYINQSNGIRVAMPPIPRIADMTGLAGIYDIRLEFGGPVIRGGLPVTTGATSPPPTPILEPNIFTAVQQQLGLKLTKVKDVPVDVLIIDHADQIPVEN